MDAGGYHAGWDPRQETRALEIPEWMRAGHALREISHHCKEEDFLAALQSFIADPTLNIIVEACLKHQVTPDDLLGEVQQYEPGF